MQQALREVEKKRLEMQREQERQRTVMAEGVDMEGAVVKRKKKRTKPKVDVEGEERAPVEEDAVKKKKKKKKRKIQPLNVVYEAEAGKAVAEVE